MDLEAELKTITDELDALMAKDVWTPEERAKVQELIDKKTQLEEQMAAEQEAAAADEELRASYNQGKAAAPAAAKKPAAAPAGALASRGRRTTSGAGAAAGLQLGKPRESFEADPKKGFKSHREFLNCVIQAGRGYTEDKRLKYLAAGSDEARGNSDAAGGYLIPTGFSPNLMQINTDDDPLAGLTTNIPMDNPIVKIPARADKNHSTSVSGGLTVTRRPDTVALTASQMTLEQVSLEAHGLFGLSYATEELLTDSPISFAALLSAGFSSQFAAHLMKERISGTGIGEYLGVINSPCLVSVTAESGQAVDTILFENVVKMRARCYGYAKAIWLANHDTLPQLMLMNQNVGTGGVPVWQPSAREDAPDLLFGRPLIFTEFAKTVGDAGDLILGNWSEYLEGVLQPLQSEESIHVRFVNHERAFKFWTRNAGAPWWRVALTPQNSTATLSPFVVLAAR